MHVLAKAGMRLKIKYIVDYVLTLSRVVVTVSPQKYVLHARLPISLINSMFVGTALRTLAIVIHVWMKKIAHHVDQGIFLFQ